MTVTRRIVVVTGASGFLGRDAAAALASRGWTVRGLVRRADAALPAGVERHVVEDLSPAGALEHALADAVAVVHLAGRAHVQDRRAARDLAAFERDNVETARSVLRAAIDARARSFVLVSSLAAESDVHGAYGCSKRAAEGVVHELADGTNLQAAILRPAMTYGPGMKGNPLRLFAAVRRGVPLPFGAVRNERSVLFSGNLSAAIAAVLETGARGVFAVADDRALSTPELIREIAAALDRPARLPAVHPAVLRALGRAGDLLPARAPNVLRSETLDRLMGSLVVDPRPLAEAAGFVAPYTTREGLRITAQWYRSQSRS